MRATGNTDLIDLQYLEESVSKLAVTGKIDTPSARVQTMRSLMYAMLESLAAAESRRTKQRNKSTSLNFLQDIEFLR